MDLLRAYGAKRVVAVAADVELGGGESERGKFARTSGAGSGTLGLPPVSNKSEREAEEVADKERKKRRVQEEKEEDVEQEEEEEEEEEEGAVGLLPRLPPAAAFVPARPVAAEPRPAAAAVAGAAPGPARPASWGYARYAEVEQETARQEEEEGEKRAAVREVRMSDLLRDQKQIQAELAHEIAAPPASLSTSFGGRKKHQLGQMAQEATAGMALYEADKVKAAATRKQVKAKYGW